MKIIAHRGNTSGPSQYENSPESINFALSLGFDVEIDVWSINESVYFGHDGPEYLVDKSTILDIGHDGWFHCKNLEAIDMFIETFPNLNYFWHQNDDFTLTSDGLIWTYPGKKIGSNSIIVLPEKIDEYILDEMLANKPYAICTDWPIKYERRR
jgi:hypothetical protein